MCICHVCNAHANHPAEGLLGPHSGGLPGKVRMLEKCLSTPIFRACGALGGAPTNPAMLWQRRPSVQLLRPPPYEECNFLDTFRNFQKLLQTFRNSCKLAQTSF